MARYVCQHQKRDNAYPFLMCGLMLKKNSFDARAAAEAYCMHQSHCSCTNRAENTDSAKNCKLLNRS